MDKITRVEPADIQRVSTLFKSVVHVLTDEHADTDGRSGAVINLCAWDGRELLHERAGTAPEDKFGSYETNALNKNVTLLENPEHQLSFQSHNMEKGPYPGGARFPVELILSISGFAWQEDEVGVLWIGYMMGWIEHEDALELVKISQAEPALLERLFGQFDHAHQNATMH